jgi:hypothetical protein
MTQVSIKPPQRWRELGDEREPKADALLSWAPAHVFARLLDDERGGAGCGASLTSLKACTDVTRIEALTEQLVPKLSGATQWPLVAVLHLPRLGRINASVRRELGGWNIELDAEEAATQRWLGGVRQQCQARLAAGLGRPVCLALPAC